MRTTCKLNPNFKGNLTLSRLVLERRCPRLLASMGCHTHNGNCPESIFFSIEFHIFPMGFKGAHVVTLKNSISLHHVTLASKDWKTPMLEPSMKASTTHSLNLEEES